MEPPWVKYGSPLRISVPDYILLVFLNSSHFYNLSSYERNYSNIQHLNRQKHHQFHGFLTGFSDRNLILFGFFCFPIYRSDIRRHKGCTLCQNPIKKIIPGGQLHPKYPMYRKKVRYPILHIHNLFCPHTYSPALVIL